MVTKKQMELNENRRLVHVVLVLIAVGACYGCCVPKKGFFGPVRILKTTVAPGMPDTGVQIPLQVYDGTHKRVGVGYFDNKDNLYTKHLLDYGKELQFIVKGDWYSNPKTAKCTKYPLRGTWGKGACIPENATKSDNFYMGHPAGQYYHPLQAVAFTYKAGSLTAKVMVTQDTCNLVGEVVYDTGSSAGAMVINRLYVNQSMETNEDFFKINPNITCVPDPNPPAMSQWDYMATFGWLLGVQQN